MNQVSIEILKAARHTVAAKIGEQEIYLKSNLIERERLNEELKNLNQELTDIETTLKENQQ